MVSLLGWTWHLLLWSKLKVMPQMTKLLQEQQQLLQHLYTVKWMSKKRLRIVVWLMLSVEQTYRLGMLGFAGWWLVSCYIIQDYYRPIPSPSLFLFTIWRVHAALREARKDLLCIKRRMGNKRAVSHSFPSTLARIRLPPQIPRINVCFWETAHLPLTKLNINTYFSFRAKC